MTRRNIRAPLLVGGLMAALACAAHAPVATAVDHNDPVRVQAQGADLGDPAAERSTRLVARRGSRSSAGSSISSAVAAPADAITSRRRARFPGWWLVDEHLAELDAEEGHTAKAIEAYRSLVARTGDPEFMDALARLIADREPEEARGLLARSRAIYEDRLARLPEASYGHALEHILQIEDDPARAVEIARENRELRLDGEARTRLAQAYLEAGRVDEACAEMRAVLATAWRSSESFATAALAFELGGHRADAAAAAAAAAEINPHAAARLDWLRDRRIAAR